MTRRACLALRASATTALLALASTCWADAGADFEKLASGLRLLREGKSAQAYEELDQVPAYSAAYPTTFVEMQKMHYATANWDKFFGFASFYRKQLLGKFYEPRLLLLEGLALTKHCQFDAANRIFDFAKQVNASIRSDEAAATDVAAKSLREAELKRRGSSEALATEIALFERQLQAASDLLDLQAKLPGRVRTTEVARSVKPFATNQLWTVAASNSTEVMSRAVRNPRALRVFVRNECTMEASP